jgi:hypothetical protein
VPREGWMHNSSQIKTYLKERIFLSWSIQASLSSNQLYKNTQLKHFPHSFGTEICTQMKLSKKKKGKEIQWD